MRVFKIKYRDRHGETKEVGRFYAEFRYDDRMRRVPLFTDRNASRDAARQIERLIACRGAGEAPDPALTKWLEETEPRLRKRLVEMGAVDARRVAAFKPLSEHLDDYRRSLIAKGTTERQAVLSHARAKKVMDGCKFLFWGEIAAGRAHSLIAGLMKGKKPLSTETANHYLVAVKQFCRWMVRDRRAAESPVAFLEKWNSRVDRKHDRRALSVDEVRRLLRAAQKGPEILGMTGPARVMLYRLALESGLRAGELRSLRRASFRLDGPSPTVTVAAGYSKRRREDHQPIRPALAADLKVFLGTKTPQAPAFNVPRREQVAQLIQGDLKAARAVWIEEATDAADRAERDASDFLVYKDAAGRFADFHALRHTFITNLVNGGVHPKTAQTLARHSTIGLTMDRYTHVLRGAEAAALAVLPDTTAASDGLRATGT